MFVLNQPASQPLRQNNMPDTIFTTAAQLGGTVFTVVMFLWYLSKRDKALNASVSKNSESNIILATSLQKLTDIVEVNTVTLNRSVDTIERNKVSLDKNTDVVDKNTDVVKSTNGKHK